VDWEDSLTASPTDLRIEPCNGLTPFTTIVTNTTVVRNCNRSRFGFVCRPRYAGHTVSRRASSVSQHFYRLLDSQLVATPLQTINLTESLRGKIALAAMGAVYHGNILDNEQRFALAVRFGNAADACSRRAANVADYWSFDASLHSA
jgi:hypothetical protein